MLTVANRLQARVLGAKYWRDEALRAARLWLRDSRENAASCVAAAKRHHRMMMEAKNVLRVIAHSPIAEQDGCVIDSDQVGTPSGTHVETVELALRVLSRGE